MRDFAKDMCTKYQFIKTTYTLYSDSWPQLEIILTNDQIYKFKSMYDLKSLISHCEIVANEKYFPNAGIIGSTKIDVNENTLVIKGSEGVIELLLKQIFQ